MKRCSNTKTCDMKRIIQPVLITLAALLAVFWQTSTQATESETTETAAQAPKIVFERSEHDFGKLVQGQAVEASFVFHNKGTSDLQIWKIESSCGCTAATVGQTRIPPGGKDAVKVRFDTTNKRGKLEKPIVVRSNDPKNPKVTLILKSVVIVELDFEPRLLLLECPKAGQTMEATVRLKNNSKRKFTLTSLESSRPEIVADIKRKTLQPNAETTLSFKISVPANIQGNLSGRLIVRTTDATVKDIFLPILVKVKGATKRPDAHRRPLPRGLK